MIIFISQDSHEEKQIRHQISAKYKTEKGLKTQMSWSKLAFSEKKTTKRQELA